MSHRNQPRTGDATVGANHDVRIQHGFVARPGAVLDPLGPTPDIVGSDLEDVARRILEVEKPA